MVAIDLGSARAVHTLGYAGPTNAAGEIDPGELGWETCQAVAVLANPVESWSDYGFQDYVYSVTPLPEGCLAILLDFNKLQRADRFFLFLFDPKDGQQKEWLHFLHRTRRLSIVNGPSGSLNSAVVVEINNQVELERLAMTLEA
jgi:hypothetical protein